MSYFVTLVVFLSQKKVGRIYFSSDLFLLVMVRHISIFMYLSQNITMCNLLDEVVSVEMINGKFNI